MKKKNSIDLFVNIFILLDIVLFCIIMLYSLSTYNGVSYEPYLIETITNSDGTSSIEIYDETLYVNHEPRMYDTSIKYNGKHYAAFTSNYDGKAYEIEYGDEYVDILYINRFRLRIRRN